MYIVARVVCTAGACAFISNSKFVVASVLLTSLASALVMLLALPTLFGKGVQISIWKVLHPVLVVTFVDFVSHPDGPFRNARRPARGDDVVALACLRICDWDSDPNRRWILGI